MNVPARILITDSDNRSALAAVRSLGRQGHTVFTAGERHPSLASVSRYSAGFDAYASPYRDPQAFIRDVAQIIQQRDIHIVLPMTEVSTLLLTGHREQLPASIQLPFPAAEAVAAASDKAALWQLAKRLGVPVPDSLIVQSASEAQSQAAQMQYPLVIKPARSRTWNGAKWLSASVSYAHSAEDLLQKLGALDPALFPVLLQERIVGPGAGVFVCMDQGEVLATFAHRRLREKPPSGGVSVLCESVAVDPIAREHATTLLRELGWRGVAMVEFKQDLRDGSLRLMEINGRFWGSLQLAIDAGVNFPELAVGIAQNTARPVDNYRQGVRSRWWWGDVDAMLSLLLKSRASLNLPPQHPGRWRTLASFLRLWQANTRYELERCDDRRPAWLAARRWLSGG